MIFNDPPFYYEASCDGCSDGERVEAESFNDALDKLKDMGWTARSLGGEWHHFCAACSEDIE